MNKNKINILSLQITPQKADKQANIEKIKNLIEKDGKNNYDLIVLPEFFDTGIDLTNKEVYDYAEEEKNSPILKELSKLAIKYNTYIHCGSICFKENKKCYNRAYLLNREGTIIAQYDKIHLFNYFGGNEGTYTTAGDKLCVVETDFGKIGLATCFDLRFPEMFTKLTKMGAEIFVLPAAWLTLNKSPKEEKELIINNWKLISKARAYDNVSYVITTNEVGKTHPILEAIGNSMIIDFNGSVLSNAQNNECAISAQLDMQKLRAARKNFPIHTLN